MYITITTVRYSIRAFRIRLLLGQILEIFVQLWLDVVHQLEYFIDQSRLVGGDRTVHILNLQDSVSIDFGSDALAATHVL